MSARIVVVFPQPDSPTSPSRSPASRLEADALDGMQLRTLEVEPDMEVADLEEASRLALPCSGRSRKRRTRKVARRAGGG